MLQESKPDVETTDKSKESTDDNSAPSNADATSTKQESGENESGAAATTEPPKSTLSTGGDNSTAANNNTASNETKIKGETKDKRLKVDLSKAPVRQYLDATVVPILLGALSAVARERPANPVEYLGNYLLEKSKEFNTD